MLRKTMIVLATVAALTGGLTVDAFAHGGGGSSGGHGGGFGGGGGHGSGFGGGHFGGGHFGGAEIGRGFGRGFAGSHFAGRHGNFGRERGFERDRGFDHRRFGRGFGVVPGWGYGCSYGYSQLLWLQLRHAARILTFVGMHHRATGKTSLASYLRGLFPRTSKIRLRTRTRICGDRVRCVNEITALSRRCEIEMSGA
jgi:hypothetical protein